MSRLDAQLSINPLETFQFKDEPLIMGSIIQGTVYAASAANATNAASGTCTISGTRSSTQLGSAYCTTHVSPQIHDISSMVCVSCMHQGAYVAYYVPVKI